jgi:hypothetical protein
MSSFEQLQEALKPLWHYAGARSADGAASAYEEEPGIEFDPKEHVLQMCWTVRGDEDFRQSLDEMCMNLNELAEQGAAIEVTFYDAEFDEEDEDRDAESRDDFLMLFVGPNPAAIMQVQRDLLVQDVVNMMERHFDGSELGGVVAEIDKLFSSVSTTSSTRSRSAARRVARAVPGMAEAAAPAICTEAEHGPGRTCRPPCRQLPGGLPRIPAAPGRRTAGLGAPGGLVAAAPSRGPRAAHRCGLVPACREPAPGAPAPDAAPGARYDSKLHVVRNALGLHTISARVQGGRLKAQHEIRIGALFRDAPPAFLSMIVVHELAHLREREHNKAFYRASTWSRPITSWNSSCGCTSCTSRRAGAPVGAGRIDAA